jgi:calcineurin-like phosphoesterase family protein
MRWFTSDLHFSHKNIVKFTNRGVETDPVRHDEWLTAKWNNTVQPGDLVYHLGDFSFHRSYEDLASQVQKLNGEKIFLKGNHDSRQWLRQLVKDGLIEAFYEYEEIKIQGNSVVLFHFPIASWHKQGHGSWHLHGHCHGNLKPEFTSGKMLDVGIDNVYNLYGQHKFLSDEDIVRYMEFRQVQVNDSHRENI